jgi:DNA-binding CsgD family transcriptional regulator
VSGRYGGGRGRSHPTRIVDGRPTTAWAAGRLLAVELEQMTRRELTVLTPTPGRLARVVALDVFGRLAPRLAVRILYDSTDDTSPAGFVDLVGGAALETSVPLPYLVVVRDRTVVYLPLRDPDHRAADRLTRIDDPVIARALCAAADVLWAATVERTNVGSRPGSPPLDGEHHNVVRALGEGLTDDRAAARLHISPRTLARRVAAVMEELDATSRFQAGVRAAHRGWV